MNYPRNSNRRDVFRTLLQHKLNSVAVNIPVRTEATKQKRD